MYKLYCSILNKRVCKWIESNDKLCDEQNGFRPDRSTIDQLSTLTSTIETIIKSKKQPLLLLLTFERRMIRSGKIYYGIS